MAALQRILDDNDINAEIAMELLTEMGFQVEWAAIPIIAVTANAFEEDSKNASAAGMNAHLAKPIDRQKMVETLAEFL